jgi:pimeloyl-ACP methyl ester carboxylesterase
VTYVRNTLGHPLFLIRMAGNAFHMTIKPLALLLLCGLVGCINISPQTRRATADELASAQGWQTTRLVTDNFVLAAYGPTPSSAEKTLTVYIEGDGLAWLSPSQASDDPTPLQPLALQLALRHGPGQAVYLARPCQYVQGPDRRGCTERDWTDGRFSLAVVQASNQAIDQLKQRYGATQLALVGYSGGGAVAALVAARRHDVTKLVTVAGNLDHRAWTTLHQLPPLSGSLNPADAWADLQDVAQLHFVGSADGNITADVLRSYQARFPVNHQPELRIIPDFDHRCCWAERWPRLRSLALP